MLQMRDFAGTKVDQLSTGMRQRAALARTLLHDPPVLILDEPTSGLDVPTARVIEEFILQARRSGKCILYSTHVMEEAEFLCDRIAVINDGRIRIIGTMSELKAATGHERLRRPVLCHFCAAAPDPKDAPMLRRMLVVIASFLRMFSGVSPGA